MMYTVRFLNERGRVVALDFNSAYRCRLFVKKASKSKKITLLSYPNSIFM